MTGRAYWVDYDMKHLAEIPASNLASAGGSHDSLTLCHSVLSGNPQYW